MSVCLPVGVGRFGGVSGLEEAAALGCRDLTPDRVARFDKARDKYGEGVDLLRLKQVSGVASGGVGCDSGGLADEGETRLVKRGGGMSEHPDSCVCVKRRVGE